MAARLTATGVAVRAKARAAPFCNKARRVVFESVVMAASLLN
jgi:hypothetical protein